MVYPDEQYPSVSVAEIGAAQPMVTVPANALYAVESGAVIVHVPASNPWMSALGVVASTIPVSVNPLPSVPEDAVAVTVAVPLVAVSTTLGSGVATGVVPDSGTASHTVVPAMEARAESFTVHVVVPPGKSCNPVTDVDPLLHVTLLELELSPETNTYPAARTSSAYVVSDHTPPTCVTPVVDLLEKVVEPVGAMALLAAAPSGVSVTRARG